MHTGSLYQSQESRNGPKKLRKKSYREGWIAVYYNLIRKYFLIIFRLLFQLIRRVSGTHFITIVFTFSQNRKFRNWHNKRKYKKIIIMKKKYTKYTIKKMINKFKINSTFCINSILPSRIEILFTEKTRIFRTIENKKWVQIKIRIN